MKHHVLLLPAALLFLSFSCGQEDGDLAPENWTHSSLGIILTEGGRDGQEEVFGRTDHLCLEAG